SRGMRCMIVLGAGILLWFVGGHVGIMTTGGPSSRTKVMPTRRGRDQSVTLVTDDWTIVVPPAAATMEGFRRWVTAPAFPERMRVTYLQGAIFLDGSNEEINTHLGVRGDVGCVLSNLVKEQRLGKFSPAGLLLSNAEAGF